MTQTNDQQQSNSNNSPSAAPIQSPQPVTRAITIEGEGEVGTGFTPQQDNHNATRTHVVSPEAVVGDHIQRTYAYHPNIFPSYEEYLEFINGINHGVHIIGEHSNNA